MLADIIVLDRDLFAVPETQIGRTKVRWAILGGRIVFAAEEGASAGRNRP